jgi:hypothetical protein
MADTSTHKNLKLMPVLDRNFTPEKRLQTKVTEFHNLKGETADVLRTYTMDVLHEYKLSDKIIAFVEATVPKILEGLQGGEQTMFLPR